MPQLQNPPSQVGHPAYTAREPQDEHDRLRAQAGPTRQLTDAGTRAAGEDVRQPGAARRGQGVR
jgi:hypothetical protein